MGRVRSAAISRYGAAISTPFRKRRFVFRKHRSLAVAALYELPIVSKRHFDKLSG